MLSVVACSSSCRGSGLFCAVWPAGVIGNDKCSEIGKKGYIKNGNNNAVKSATIVQ